MERVPFDEAPWIEHCGGECPIPWVQAFEWEFEHLQKRRLVAMCNANSAIWGLISAWRLTDGWLPVLNGEMPKEIAGAEAGEWEYKFHGEISFKADRRPREYGLAWWKHNNTPYDVLAVRLIKQKFDCHSHENKVCDVCRSTNDYHSSECYAASQAIKTELKPFDQDQYDAPYQRINDARKAAAPLDLSVKRPKETEQKRLDREAYERWQAKNPKPQVVPPIGDIESRIFAAMCESFKGD